LEDLKTGIKMAKNNGGHVFVGRYDMIFDNGMEINRIKINTEDLEKLLDAAEEKFIRRI